MNAAIHPGFELPEPAERMRVTSRDGLGLNVEIHGRPDAEQTVVLIHGWTSSIRIWAPVIRSLGDDVRIIAYDLRGHGRSDVAAHARRRAGRPALPSPYTTAALADDLTAVLDHTLPPGGKAVLAGHSMGGMTIMAAAAREPALSKRASGVLLASTGCQNLVTRSVSLPLSSRLRRTGPTLQRMVMMSAAPLGPMTRLSSAALKYPTLGAGAPAEMIAVNAAIIHACDRRARAGWGRTLTSLDVADGASRLDVPAHVLVGTADRLTPRVHARHIAGLLPHCEGLTELPDVGHMTPLEAPHVITDLIRALAARPVDAP
ncbi:MAG TPA: alpha/beta hydrolase [Streptosporangiaceae bacterium]|jgi:pimeloyl-ACP methyl ester carboxylesterase|nr:alpha/beta hydrolase [Streptosporangiaceae bacterium]